MITKCDQQKTLLDNGAAKGKGLFLIEFTSVAVKNWEFEKRPIQNLQLEIGTLIAQIPGFLPCLHLFKDK